MRALLIYAGILALAVLLPVRFPPGKSPVLADYCATAQQCFLNIERQLPKVSSSISPQDELERSLSRSYALAGQEAERLRSRALDQFKSRLTQSQLTEQDERRFIRSLAYFGNDAVPYLLHFVNGPHKERSRQAGRALSAMPPLSEKSLATLIDANKRSGQSLLLAIAKIPSDKAAEYLIWDFLQQADTYDHYDEAFALLGTRALKPLLSALGNSNLQVDKRGLAFDKAFSALGRAALPAHPMLMQMAMDEKRPIDVRRQALSCIGATGAAEPSIVKQLAVIQSDEANPLQNSATSALMEVGAKEGALITAQDIKSFLDGLDPAQQEWLAGRHGFEELIALGHNGYDAGPVLMELAHSPQWDIRPLAAETLGAIGYTPARELLERVLDNEEDWRLVLRAAEALGRLQQNKSLPALQKTAITHWSPAVRKQTRSAIDQLFQHAETRKHKSFVPRKKRPKNLPWFPDNDDNECSRGYVSHRNNEKICGCDPYRVPALTLSLAAKRVQNYRDSNMREFAFTEENGVYRSVARGAGAFDALVPEAALRVDGGWLLAWDRGEWGGALLWQPDDGPMSEIFASSVSDVHAFAGGYVFITGFSDPSFYQGLVYRLEQDKSKNWKIHPWRTLPTTATQSWLTPQGDLFVDTYGGAVLIHPDGRMRLVPCDSKHEALALAGW